MTSAHTLSPLTTLHLNAPPLQFVDLAGYRMAYRQWGRTDQTEAIVLIHGITSSSLGWIRVAPGLAQHARVIAFDLKGHGDSDRAARGYRLADQADEVEQLLESLGLRVIKLISHAWGGAISAILAFLRRLRRRDSCRRTSCYRAARFLLDGRSASSCSRVLVVHDS